MLTQIPTEVLTNILDHLVRPYSEAVDDVTPPTHIPGVDDESWWYVPDYRSLSSVCLTSRKLRDIGQRVLYHSFKLDHGRVWSDYWEEDREYTWKGRLIMFLRTLLLRPDLAALVRTCFITAHLVAAVGEKEAKQALRNAARIRGVDLSKFLQPFRASAWCERPMRDGVLVMILACLPNLSGLYLSGALDEEGENTMFFNIFRPSLKAAGVTSLGLQTLGLELVRDDYERHRTRTRRPCVADLLEMASSTLQNFYALNCEFDLDSLAQPLPKLRNVSVAPDDVDYTPLLSSCEGLERFALHVLPDTYGYEERPISQNLNRHRGTLKALRVETGVPLPDLSSFPVLQDLYLNGESLQELLEPELEDLGQDVPSSSPPGELCRRFPSSLVSLNLSLEPEPYNLTRRSIGSRFLEEFATWVYQGRFPRLKSVSVEETLRTKFDGLDYQHLRDVAVNAGVLFEHKKDLHEESESYRFKLKQDLLEIDGISENVFEDEERVCQCGCSFKPKRESNEMNQWDGVYESDEMDEMDESDEDDHDDEEWDYE